MGFLIKTGMFILLFKCEPSKKSVFGKIKVEQKVTKS